MSESDNFQLNELINILKDFIEFLEPFKKLLNTYNVQFLVEDHWNNDQILAPVLRNDLEKFINKPENETNVNLVKYFHQFEPNFNGTELEKSFSTIKKFKRIWQEKVLTPIETLVDLKGNAEFDFEKLQKQNRFMKVKKVHEVDIMSKFVALLCKKLNIETVSRKIIKST